jgi:hypothetical protein
MKKTLLIIAMAILPAVVFAQGTVQFNNTTTTRMTTNSTATPPPGQQANQTGNTTGAGLFTVGLYIAPAGTTDQSLFTLVGTTPSLTGIGAGTFNGNPPDGGFAIPGNTGQTIAFQIRAWQTSGGSTYEAATTVYRGVSAIGSVTPATGLILAPALFGTGPGQIGGFVLTPGVPEPSSIAFGLLGLGAVALFRRKK